MLPVFLLTTPRTSADGTTVTLVWHHPTCQQVSLRGCSKRGGILSIDISGFDCIIVKVVIIFLAFCSLSFCCCSASLSGAVFPVAPRKNDSCISYQALSSVSGTRSQSIRPPPIPCTWQYYERSCLFLFFFIA